MMSFSVDRIIGPMSSDHRKPHFTSLNPKKSIYEETRIRLLEDLKPEPSTTVKTGEQHQRVKEVDDCEVDVDDACDNFASDKAKDGAVDKEAERMAIVPFGSLSSKTADKLQEYNGSGGVKSGGSTEKPNGVAKQAGESTDSRHVETFVAVIAQAILSAPGKRMTLSSIYHYIASNYSHFNREKGPGWRNSVRHNLSSNDCFVKAGRAENGKGHYWMIHPKDVPEFSKGNFRRRRKPRRPRCHHSVMFNTGSSSSAAENAFFYAHALNLNPERILSAGSPLGYSLVADSGKLPLMGHYDRPQYIDMSRTAAAANLTVPPSLLWPSEISSRTFPAKFATTGTTGLLNFHQFCACHSPGLQCYYHKC